MKKLELVVFLGVCMLFSSVIHLDTAHKIAMETNSLDSDRLPAAYDQDYAHKQVLLAKKKVGEDISQIIKEKSGSEYAIISELIGDLLKDPSDFSYQLKRLRKDGYISENSPLHDIVVAEAKLKVIKNKIENMDQSEKKDVYTKSVKEVIGDDEDSELFLAAIMDSYDAEMSNIAIDLDDTNEQTTAKLCKKQNAITKQAILNNMLYRDLKGSQRLKNGGVTAGVGALLSTLSGPLGVIVGGIGLITMANGGYNKYKSKRPLSILNTYIEDEMEAFYSSKFIKFYKKECLPAFKKSLEGMKSHRQLAGKAPSCESIEREKTTWTGDYEYITVGYDCNTEKSDRDYRSTGKDYSDIWGGSASEI